MNKKKIFLKSYGIMRIFSVLLLAVCFSGCPQPQDNSPKETPKFTIPAPSVIRGNGELFVGWAAETGVNYAVWYGTDNNSGNAEKWNGTVTVSPPAAGTVIGGLNNGTAYYVWIKAEADGALSDFSRGTPEAPPTAIPENFVYVPGGTITGSDAYAMSVTVPPGLGYMNEGKTLSKKGVFVEGRTTPLDSFFMAKHETTRQLWHEVQSWAGDNGYHFQNTISAPNESNKNKPVSNISWRDAVVWCNAYSEKSNLEPVYFYPAISNENALKDSRNANGTACDGAIMDAAKNGFRLPTEVEREYAARGGNPGKADWMFLYAGSDNADEAAWHHGNSPYAIQDVGTKNPNRLGVFDLSGNAQEWGWDWINYNTAVTAGTPWDGESYGSRFNQKPMAGGGVGSNITMSCTTDRWGYGTSYKDGYVGLRLVRKVE